MCILDKVSFAFLKNLIVVIGLLNYMFLIYICCLIYLLLIVSQSLALFFVNNVLKAVSNFDEL